MTQKEKREYHKGVFDSIKNNKTDFGKIGTFVAFEELRSILKKVKNGQKSIRK